MNTRAHPTTAPGWSYPLGLFQATGVELEYMIVDRDTLDVRPIADRVFAQAAGRETSDVEPDGDDGVISWSNELALHVIELKTQRPAPALEPLADAFQDHVGRVNALLEPMNARLLPTAMHPWMDPDTETRLWPHENNEIYATYHRIFGCKGHGWGNLQSTHINLPFANDDEFGRLHAAIRIVLPLIPALAASSPIADGKPNALADYRMEVYRTNAKRVPMMNGLIVPEPVFTRAGYETDILGKLYDDLAPLDPEGILRHEFANARGGMARFDRGAIEIRVIDIQECPAMDLAVVALVTQTVRALVEQRWTTTAAQQAVATEPLHAVLLDTMRDAEHAVIRDRTLLDAFGIADASLTAGEAWHAIANAIIPQSSVWHAPVHRLLSAGTLSTRLRRAVGVSPSRDDLRVVFGQLADCLRDGTPFA